MTIPPEQAHVKWTIGGVLFLVALVFVYRSFYGMRIPEEQGLKKA